MTPMSVFDKSYEKWGRKNFIANFLNRNVLEYFLLLNFISLEMTIQNFAQIPFDGGS